VLYELCTGRDRQDFPSFPHNGRNSSINKACSNSTPSPPLMKPAPRCPQRYQPRPTCMHLALLQAWQSQRLRLVERRLASLPGSDWPPQHCRMLAVGGYFGAVKQARRAQRAERRSTAALCADINRPMQFWEKGTLNAPWNCWNHTAPLHVPQPSNPLSRRIRWRRKSTLNLPRRLARLRVVLPLAACHKDDALSTWRASLMACLHRSFSPDSKILAGSGYSGRCFLGPRLRGSPLQRSQITVGISPTWSSHRTPGRSPTGLRPAPIELWDLRSKQSWLRCRSTNRSTYC